MTSKSHIWGTTLHELLLDFPCDRFIEVFDEAYYRGITIQSKPEIIFRWLCQMRVAPYSYDWIDNFGRRSPRKLIPGLDNLEVGQTVMTIFELLDFKRNQHITIRIKKDIFALKFFGDTGVSYLIIPQSNGKCRLIVKLLVRYPQGILGVLMRLMLPWGDLIMMRRQLINFKELSEMVSAS
jgi:hypothetical protein